LNGLELRAADATDLAFARDLTRETMLRYYIRHDLLWLDEAFDVAWAGRKNWLVCRAETVLGFVSLSRDANALYIRELHVVERFRGQGVGAWVIEQVRAMASHQRRGLLRLTVFKDNPAQALYRRMGLSVVGEDECFLRMERSSAVSG